MEKKDIEDALEADEIEEIELTEDDTIAIMEGFEKQEVHDAGWPV